MDGEQQIGVRVVDDHPSMLAGTAAVLSTAPDIRVLGLYESAEALLTSSDMPVADVVLLDLHMGRDGGLSTPWIGELVAQGARILLHTSIESPVPLRAAVRAGAHGLCLKNDPLDALKEAVRQVAAGEFACSSSLAQALLDDVDLIAKLTEREVEVVRNLDDGLTHDEIARRLTVAPSTIKAHLKSVRAKYVDLGRSISNAHSIAREVRREGWLD